MPAVQCRLRVSEALLGIGLGTGSHFGAVFVIGPVHIGDVIRRQDCSLLTDAFSGRGLPRSSCRGGEVGLRAPPSPGAAEEFLEQESAGWHTRDNKGNVKFNGSERISFHGEDGDGEERSGSHLPNNDEKTARPYPIIGIVAGGPVVTGDRCGNHGTMKYQTEPEVCIHLQETCAEDSHHLGLPSQANIQAPGILDGNAKDHHIEGKVEVPNNDIDRWLNSVVLCQILCSPGLAGRRSSVDSI